MSFRPSLRKAVWLNYCRAGIHNCPRQVRASTSDASEVACGKYYELALPTILFFGLPPNACIFLKEQISLTFVSHPPNLQP